MLAKLCGLIPFFFRRVLENTLILTGAVSRRYPWICLCVVGIRAPCLNLLKDSWLVPIHDWRKKKKKATFDARMHQSKLHTSLFWREFSVNTTLFFSCLIHPAEKSLSAIKTRCHDHLGSLYNHTNLAVCTVSQTMLFRKSCLKYWRYNPQSIRNAKSKYT